MSEVHEFTPSDNEVEEIEGEEGEIAEVEESEDEGPQGQAEVTEEMDTSPKKANRLGDLASLSKSFADSMTSEELAEMQVNKVSFGVTFNSEFSQSTLYIGDLKKRFEVANREINVAEVLKRNEKRMNSEIRAIHDEATEKNDDTIWNTGIDKYLKQMNHARLDMDGMIVYAGKEGSRTDKTIHFVDMNTVMSHCHRLGQICRTNRKRMYSNKLGVVPYKGAHTVIQLDVSFKGQIKSLLQWMHSGDDQIQASRSSLRQLCSITHYLNIAAVKEQMLEMANELSIDYVSAVEEKAGGSEELIKHHDARIEELGKQHKRWKNKKTSMVMNMRAAGEEVGVLLEIKIRDHLKKSFNEPKIVAEPNLGERNPVIRALMNMNKPLSKLKDLYREETTDGAYAKKLNAANRRERKSTYAEELTRLQRALNNNTNIPGQRKEAMTKRMKYLQRMIAAEQKQSKGVQLKDSRKQAVEGRKRPHMQIDPGHHHQPPPTISDRFSDFPSHPPPPQVHIPVYPGQQVPPGHYVHPHPPAPYAAAPETNELKAQLAALQAQVQDLQHHNNRPPPQQIEPQIPHGHPPHGHPPHGYPANGHEAWQPPRKVQRSQGEPLRPNPQDQWPPRGQENGGWPDAAPQAQHPDTRYQQAEAYRAPMQPNAPAYNMEHQPLSAGSWGAPPVSNNFGSSEFNQNPTNSHGRPQSHREGPSEEKRAQLRGMRNERKELQKKRKEKRRGQNVWEANTPPAFLQQAEQQMNMRRENNSQQTMAQNQGFVAKDEHRTGAGWRN